MFPIGGFSREEVDFASGSGPASWPLQHYPGGLTLPCSMSDEKIRRLQLSFKINLSVPSCGHCLDLKVINADRL